jgi:uncharacterized protein (DUF2236 family)
MRFLTVGLLPERVRAGYGLTWGPQRDRVFAALASALRGGVVPCCPVPCGVGRTRATRTAD